MVDACFAIPRLAAIYDAVDGPREDLDLYTAIASQLGATTIADIGCGTGTFACAMAARGFEVTGIDPAAASVAIARTKRFADQVHWIVGDINKLDGLDVDLLTMTGKTVRSRFSMPGQSRTGPSRYEKHSLSPATLSQTRTSDLGSRHSSTTASCQTVSDADG